MKLRTATLCLVAGLLELCLLTPGKGAVIVDQEQSIGTGPESANQPVFGTSSSFFVPWSVAQSFVPSASNIAGADILVQNLGFAGLRQINVAIFDDRPDLGGTQIAGQIVAFNQTNATTGNVTVEARWSPVEIDAGSTYYLALAGAQSSDLLVRSAIFDPYPPGALFVAALDRTGNLIPSPGRDLAFRTYTDPDFDPGTGEPIPEPASIGLFASGLALLAVWRRQRAA